MTARVRKARKSSRLACGCFVLAGAYIVRRADGTWACRDCVLAAQGRSPLGVPSSGTPAGETGE
jgi:hypothetical protein